MTTFLNGRILILKFWIGKAGDWEILELGNWEISWDARCLQILNTIEH